MGSAGNKAIRTVSWLLIAVVALVLGVATAFEMRGALEREPEFRAAPTCASVPVKASGCVWQQEFTVRKADAHRGEERVAGGRVVAAIR